MTVQLLPPDFDDLAAKAVVTFWGARVGGVRSGKNLDAFIDLVATVGRHCGLPDEAVLTRRGSGILPGYFRATKNWDVLVIHRRRLVAVFEFKSQTKDFGNNFNNRAEEVVGAATDLWVTHRAGAYGVHPEDGGIPAPRTGPDMLHDPRPPFLGWLMLLAECAESMSPVRVDEPNYGVFPEFRGASYAKRYQILCERLVERQLYGSAALVLSEAETGAATGEHRSLSEATSLRTFFAEFAAKIAASNEGAR